MTDAGVPRLSPEMASRKLQALAFIERYWTIHRTGPSLSEIAAALGTNRTRAKDAVIKLAREGRIYRVTGLPRGIRPLTAEEEMLRQAQLTGYIVTKAALPEMPVLDHPAGHGPTKIPQKSKRRRQPGSAGPEAAERHGAGAARPGERPQG